MAIKELSSVLGYVVTWVGDRMADLLELSRLLLFKYSIANPFMSPLHWAANIDRW